MTKPIEASITVTIKRDIYRIPRHCSECCFSTVCDGTVAKLTKNDGVEWTARAMKTRIKQCPMKINSKPVNAINEIMIDESKPICVDEQARPKETGHSTSGGYVTPKQYAENNGISRMTVYRALWDGRIEGAVRLHKQWRIPADAQML